MFSAVLGPDVPRVSNMNISSIFWGDDELSHFVVGGRPRVLKSAVEPEICVARILNRAFRVRMARVAVILGAARR